MSARVRRSIAAFRAAVAFEPDTTTPAQRARIEARLIPLTRQARQKFVTLAALTPADP
jgi:hypothetical protein